MVLAIRLVERALGDGIKKPTDSELRNVVVARKSIVADRAICKGEKLTESNLAVKRPAIGFDPMRWDEVIGTYAVRDFQADESITLS